MQTDSKKVAIYLTNKCNLQCKHCFIEGSPANDVFLSWPQISTALYYFIRHGYNRAEFTGGEACLSAQLLPATKLAKELGYTVGVNSNGINRRLPYQLNPSQVDKITFSLDGATPETHDFLRGPNVFNICLQTIRASITAGYHTEVIFTVHKRNQQEIPLIIKLLDDLGVERLSFNFISNQGTAILNQDLLLPPEAWIAAKKSIETNSQTKNLSLRYPILFATREEFAAIKQHHHYFCRLLDPVKAEVYPTGYIYHCCLVTDISNLHAGKVTDTRVIMRPSAERNFVKKYQHLSCPVHEVRKLYAHNSDLVPICLYYKEITHQSTS